MDTSKIILISLTKNELQNLITNAVNEALKVKQEKELLSFKETCEFLSCSHSALNKWKSENKIPFRKLGKRIYFNRNEIIVALKDAGNYKKLKELE